VECRHPFFDLRVLTWLMAIPPVPWCDQKEVLRLAMAGLLPRPLLRRPKAGCHARWSLTVPLLLPVRRRRERSPDDEPIRTYLSRRESAWVDAFEPAPELAEYVIRDRIPRLFGEHDGAAIWANLRPLSLNQWLSRRSSSVALARVSLNGQPASDTGPVSAS